MAYIFMASLVIGLYGDGCLVMAYMAMAVLLWPIWRWLFCYGLYSDGCVVMAYIDTAGSAAK